MKIQIEKNIPIAPLRNRESDFNFIDEMEIGDSFVYATKSRQSMMNGMNKYCISQNLEYEFTSRVNILKKEECRIWRIK